MPNLFWSSELIFSSEGTADVQRGLIVRLRNVLLLIRNISRRLDKRQLEASNRRRRVWVSVALWCLPVFRPQLTHLNELTPDGERCPSGLKYLIGKKVALGPVWTEYSRGRKDKNKLRIVDDSTSPRQIGDFGKCTSLCY